MIGPCDEGNATGRGQSVKSTLDPLEPAIDVALNDLGGVWSQYPKVPRTTRRACKRVGHNECLRNRPARAPALASVANLIALRAASLLCGP